MNLTIRLARPDDYETTVALNMASYATAYVCADCGITEKLLRDHVYDQSTNPPSFGMKTAEYHREWLKNPDVRFAVACIGDKVVGFAATEPHGGGRFLDGLYVHPDYQGRRVGSFLLDDVEADAGSHVSLWAVEHSRSLGFYLSRGYRHVVGIDASVKLVGGPSMGLAALIKP